ncbi:MAG: hypothetical protein HY711_07295 [Candidatus Melainabacteria bacterium]|nr:hypothetical protein [Candidatus Melainabacteria bacterium]
MRNKLASSLVLAMALIGSVVAAPSYADDDGMFKSIVQLPVRMLGSAAGGAIGMPEGAVKDGVKGCQMATKWVAGKLGDEDGKYQTWAGMLFGGPVGLAGGGAYGVFDGGWHGMKTGWEKPFSKESFTFKEE